MWNENKYLLRGHIVEMWNEDNDSRLKVLRKLVYYHIALRLFSTMCVRYTTQALNNTMSTILKQFGTPDLQKRATFLKYLTFYLNA